MTTGEITLPYGKITDKKLEMHFNAYDIDLPVIASGIRERMDVLRELGVAFAGFGTEVPQNVTQQNPAIIKAFFEFTGTTGDAQVMMKRVYHIIWCGMIQEFPDLIDWAQAKADLSNLTYAQAEIMRARRSE